VKWRTRTQDAPDPALEDEGPFSLDIDGDDVPDLIYPAPRPAPRATPGGVIPSWGTPPSTLPQGEGEEAGEPSLPLPEGDPQDAPEGDPEWVFEDDPGPSSGPVLHADVTIRDTDVRPVLPAWAKTREGRKAAARWWLGVQRHRVAFHGVRLPSYAGKILYRAPRGTVRSINAWRRWAFDALAAPVEQVIASKANPDAKEFMLLREQRSARTRARLAVTGGLALGAVLGVVLALALWWPALALAAVLALVLLAVAGTDRDQPLVPQAIATYEAPKLTAPVIERAFKALQIKAINDALAPGGTGLDYPSPIHRDEGGRGWRAEVDLPHGVTAADIMERRSSLASGLRRPLGCVWPESAPEVHEGRLILRVLDVDFSKAKTPPWPLAKVGRHDYFDPYPFGWDTRFRLIKVALFELNMLIGAMMGQGKSATMRVAACAAALDPTVELWICELLGKGDFEELEPVLHRYVNGVDDESITRAAAYLHELRLEVERRTVQLGKVPTDMKPDKKVTREIANHRAWGLYPLVAIFDEVQNLFTHAGCGKQAREDAEFVIRSARAVAVTLILGTQIPDKESVPPAVTRLAGLRFCLKVMDHTANDMILGTGMHKNGYKANAFRSKVDAGTGILVGATDVPAVVKSAYLDGPAVKKIAQRARDLRERAGTITGHAAGIDDDEVSVTVVNVAQDVRAVFRADETGLHNQLILHRLKQLRPGYYDSWVPDQITTALKAAGVEAAGAQIERYDETEERRVNRRGVYLKDLQAALPSNPEPTPETP
jgi:S-DNA-T family DNA segregation ATPase FtsK/SpoIIIE